MQRRERLAMRIFAFEQKASTFMMLDEDTKWSSWGENTEDGIDGDWSDESDEATVGEVVAHPEMQNVSLPSALGLGEIPRLGIEHLATQEGSLRRGQITDALAGLRMALGEKSLLFRTQVRNARSQRTTLKAWKEVNKQDADARKHRKAYLDAREALRRLNVDSEYVERLQDITKEDMKMAGDVTEENRMGQRSSTLAWFWRLGEDPAVEETDINPRLKECE